MINVDGKYYISADKYCYTLNRKQYNKAQGTDIFIKMTYHRTLRECIDKIITLKYKDFINSKEVSLKKSLDELLMLKKQYHDALDGIEADIRDNDLKEIKVSNAECENIENIEIIDEADLENQDASDELNETDDTIE
mgnify:FL=1